MSICRSILCMESGMVSFESRRSVVRANLQRSARFDIADRAIKEKKLIPPLPPRQGRPQRQLKPTLEILSAAKLNAEELLDYIGNQMNLTGHMTENDPR